MVLPSPGAVLELLKPVTWFAPMWAFACGVVSAGVSTEGHWIVIIAGVIMCGPLLVASSQAVNDWFDRHVDAINEPDRPIPSGRIPGRWGLYIGIIWTGLAAGVAALLGPWVLAAASIGLALSWAYSAPPFRLKRNGWWGNAACAISYEGLAWFAGAAVMISAFPDWPIVALALLYSVGAHGIMTLNDFKSVAGDEKNGIRTLPVQLGVERAALVACYVMALPQAVVVVLLLYWGHPLHAIVIVLSMAIQFGLMLRLLGDPREQAAWYNATGTSLYVLGMMVSAFAVASS